MSFLFDQKKRKPMTVVIVLIVLIVTISVIVFGYIIGMNKVNNQEKQSQVSSLAVFDN